MQDKYRLIAQTLRNLNMDSSLIDAFKDHGLTDDSFSFLAEWNEVSEDDPKFLEFGCLDRNKFYTEFKRILLNENEGQNSFGNEDNSFTPYFGKENLKKMSQDVSKKLLEQGLKKYSESMDKWTEKRLFKKRDLNNTHMEIKGEILEEFSKLEIFKKFPSDEQNHKVLKYKLEKKINKLYFENHKWRVFDEKKQVLKKKIQKTMEYYENAYSQMMRKHNNSDIFPQSYSNFCNIHDECCKKVKFEFEEKISQILQNPQEILDKFDQMLWKKKLSFFDENNGKNHFIFLLLVVLTIILALTFCFCCIVEGYKKQLLELNCANSTTTL